MLKGDGVNTATGGQGRVPQIARVPSESGADKPTRRGAAVVVLGALALQCLSGSCMNASFFPLFDTVFPFARDIGMFANAGAFLALVPLANLRPSVFRPLPWALGSVALWFCGLACALWGLSSSSTPALVAGCIVNKAAGSVLSTFVFVACCGVLEGPSLQAGVPLALLAATAADCVPLPSAVGVVLYAVLPPVGLALAYRTARPLLNDIRRGPAATDASLASPASYLPLGNRLYVYLVLFAVTIGFSLRLGPEEGTIMTMPVTMATYALLAFWGLHGGGRRHLDLLFHATVLLVVGSCLLMPVRSLAMVSTVLLALGTSCASALTQLSLVAVGSRNPLACIPAYGWCKALCCTATIVGANMGALTTASAGQDGKFLVSGILALVLLAGTLFPLEPFSFDETIRGLRLLEPVTPPPAESEERIAQACSRLAEEHCLTPREAQVLELLAHGRNNSYIQENLFITRNTAKSHIKHVYQKLDVHSQQELIDLTSR